MKMKHYITLLWAAVLAVGVIGCTQSESDDTRETVPPGPVSNVQYEASYGGGVLTYNIPSDKDFLYVRAEYTIDNGMTISRTSSRYNKSLELTGMDLGPYLVKVYAVDVNGNESEPVEIEVEPLGATVGPISETLSITPGFGLFYINVENEYGTIVDVCVDMWVDNKLIATRTFTTAAVAERVKIDDLKDDIKYTLDVKIRDNRYAYESEVTEFGNYQVLSDDTLDMKPLKVVEDPDLYGPDNWDYTLTIPTQNLNKYQGAPKTQITISGMKVQSSTYYKFDKFRNAAIRHNEGGVYLFWDGRTDTHFESGDYDVGQGPDWPWCYFVDMGRKVQLSRFRIWQVGGSHFGVNSGGCKTFEFWGSNDPNPADGLLSELDSDPESTSNGWVLIGRYTFRVPASDIDIQKEFEEGTEFYIDEDNPKFSRTFRYWRFVGVSDWPAASGGRYWASGRLAEIVLMGKEVEE